MSSRILLSILATLVLTACQVGPDISPAKDEIPPHDIRNFSHAKDLLREVYREHPTSFYCGCDFHYEGKKLVPDLNGCGYQIRKETQRVRAERIEWEHVVPASTLGSELACWQDGGRKGCRGDEDFHTLEADLHNLAPAIGEVNGDRSNYQFGYWHTDLGAFYGTCEMKVDFKGRQAHPPQRSRGAIARTYLYMQDRYNIQLSQREQELFQSWNDAFAPDAWECTRNEQLTRLQGNDNPFVTQACRAQ